LKLAQMLWSYKLIQPGQSFKTYVLTIILHNKCYGNYQDVEYIYYLLMRNMNLQVWNVRIDKQRKMLLEILLMQLKLLVLEVNPMTQMIFALKWDKILIIKIFSLKINKKIGKEFVGEILINVGLMAKE